MPAPPRLTLWGVGTSRTVRAHWAMAELGLAYETRAIGARTGETQTAEYTALNPRQKIPLLQDGDFCIGESAATGLSLSCAQFTAPQVTSTVIAAKVAPAEVRSGLLPDDIGQE